MPDDNEVEASEEPKRNCNYWAPVDFGMGTVMIRCTMAGPHEDCMCVVLMGDDKVSPESNGAEG